ncbi:MAG: hypothetical protein WCL22_07095, partial [bacterium]
MLDWFNGAPYAVKGIGRVDATGAFTSVTVDNPRLYDLVLNLSSASYSKSIASITFAKTGTTGAAHIFAVSLASSTTSVLCNNSQIMLSSYGAGTGLGVQYQWQSSTTSGGPYTDIAGANQLTYTTPALTSNMYYVLKVSCALAGSPSFTNEVAASVSTPTPITITASANGVFCGNGTLTASATGLTGYVWTPSSALQSNTGTTVTSIATANTTFTVTASDVNGCANTASQAITYTAPPAITLTGAPASFCGTGGTTTITATSTGNYIYNWIAFNGAVLSNQTLTSANATVTQTSTIQVSGSDPATGCANVGYASIGVYPLPTATLSTTANGVCPGTSATINSGLSAGNFTVGCISTATNAIPTTANYLVNNGTAVVTQASGNLDDGGWSSIPLGFNFNFFGTSYTTVNVGTNGVLQFGAYNSTALGTYTIGALPSTSYPMGAIYLAANDLNTGTAGTPPTYVRYWTDGVAPNRTFNVEYRVYQYGSTTNIVNLRAICYETIG